MPDFKMQQSFPIASVVDAYQKKGQLENDLTLKQSEMINQSMQAIGTIGQSLLDRRKRMAQAMILSQQPEVADMLSGGDRQVTTGPDGKPVRIDQTAAGGVGGDPKQNSPAMSAQNSALLLEGAHPLEVMKQAFARKQAMKPVEDIIAQKDAAGNIIGYTHVTRQKAGKTLFTGPQSVSPGSQPAQTQFVDSDGTPLIFNKATQSYSRANIQPGVTPVLKKGDAGAIGDATLLANQIPNIKTMFDAYRTSSSPRLQSTAAGRLLNPSGKQAENSLKLAAFTFGGKNLTGQEKDVVFGALFPSWTDDEQSRSAKEKLLTDYTAGKIDLLQAANLLGPAGSKMRQMLGKYENQAGAQQVPVVAAAPKPMANPDLAHLSTKELMDLRAKMTAHKEPKK